MIPSLIKRFDVALVAVLDVEDVAVLDVEDVDSPTLFKLYRIVSPSYCPTDK